MKKPTPAEGLVIRYDYLWKDEQLRGRIEGHKDRPCAIVMAVTIQTDGSTKILVVPITHSPPQSPKDAIEIPQKIKMHLGLDNERSWIITTELNRVRWDDAGIIPARKTQWEYGALPQPFVKKIQDQVRTCALERRLRSVDR